MKDDSLFNLKSKDFIFALVVVVVVSGLTVNQLITSQIRARDAQRRADTELIGRALVLYYKENGFFPKAEDGRIVSCGESGQYTCEWGDDRIIDANDLEYLKNLPRDPFFDQGYEYVYQTDAEQINFKIFARLENTRDPVVRKDLGVMCGEDECNWVVENSK